MSRYSSVMVLGCDAAAQLRIIGHIDPVSETEEPIVLRPLRGSDGLPFGPPEFHRGLCNSVLLFALAVSLANIPQDVTFFSFQ
jgi:hypothetical protein